MLQTDNYLRFQQVTAVEATPHGLIAEVGGEQLRIDLIRPDVVRFKISRGREFDESPTFAVCVDPLSSEPVEFTLQSRGGAGGSSPPESTQSGDEEVRLVTSEMTVTLGLDPFRLDVHRSDGTAVVESAADADGNFWTYATLNDAWTVRHRCRREDAIFGLGQKSGRHNRKGRDFTLWNTDVLNPYETLEFTAGKAPDDPRGDRTSVEFDPYYVSIPYFYHQTYPAGTMAASFVDNGYRGAYEFSQPEEYRISFRGGQYTEYVFAGPAMPEILHAYTWLTGRAAPPPLWSLGYHQCRWFHYTQDAVEALGQQHRDNDIPCDALWLDIEYMDGYRVFTWNTELFPDPRGMLERLAEQGFRVITIIDPGVKYEPGYPVFDAGLERDAFCRTEGGDIYIGQVWPGNTAFPDFVTEEARSWWGELNAAHVGFGLAGIWNDMNEPATGNIEPRQMHFDHGRYSHERYRNQYALLMAMGTRSGLLSAMPERRTFILSRSGFAGIQRYAANWLGDNQSRWDHLRLSIAMGAGFGISGQPFLGADIGGFQGNSNGELFLRWMQYGTLTPFCRNHSEIGNVDQYAWAWGELVRVHVRAAVKLRYRLLPYLYACFLTATETGAPVQRPLVFDYQHDGSVRDIDDEFLLGPDLLVAPVTGPGVTARQVYLPAGDWYDWHSGELVGGTRFVVAETPMDRIPIYARGGAVIPMWAEAPATTAGYHPKVVELHVFVPAADGSHTSILAEDDGLTNAVLDGACYRTTFTLTRSGDQVFVQAEVTGDGYPEFSREQFALVVHGAEPATVRLDGDEISGSDRRILLPNAGTGFTLELAIG